MILVVGTGVAGLSCALAAARAGAEVLLVTEGRIAGSGAGVPGTGGVTRATRATRADGPTGGGSTALAQGGIAAAIAPGDTTAAHLADTVAAGAGLVDAEAAEVLVTEGAAAVRELIAAGLPIDRDASGAPLFCLEGAHSAPRIVHAGGDRTGAVLHEFLTARVTSCARDGRNPISLLEERSLVSLLVDAAGGVSGAVLRTAAGDLETVRADAVVLATGGYSATFARSTNPASSRGDGIVLAARVGAVVADLEFVQFHPTVLSGTGVLVSEAVRGAGAVLRDGTGARFMADRHPLAELAPRDVVSREALRVMAERGEAEVWLDATAIERDGGPGTLARRFPGIAAALAEHGLDWTAEPIPVSPAAHYTMGGVATDLDGRTTVPGLFAAGEVACTGVHGANRLASNSLLEGLVFGDRAGRAAAAYAAAAAAVAVVAPAAAIAIDATVATGGNTVAPDQRARDWTLRGTGIERLVAEAVVVAAEGGDAAARADRADDAPLADPGLARMIGLARAARTESRGAHQRSDHPDTDPAPAQRRGYRLALHAPADPPPIAHHPRSLASC